jgi:hypothetical protein
MTKTKVVLILGGLFAVAGVVSLARAEEAGKKIDWEKMSKDERKKYMKTVVAPEMKKAFVAFNAKAYANMNCVTCHGDGATDGTFKMPNPKLPKLPAPKDQAGFMALMQKKPDVVKFMSGQVKPKMATLLNMPEWTPQKPVGFSCYNCHTHDGGGAAPPAK